jgi:hypothetical protein
MFAFFKSAYNSLCFDALYDLLQEKKVPLSDGAFFQVLYIKTCLLDKRMTLSEIAFSKIFLDFPVHIQK